MPQKRKDGPIKSEFQRFPDEFLRLANLNLQTRAFALSSYDEKTRSAEGIFTTETPVRVFDWERYEVVNEILLMSGMRFSPIIPFIDSHNYDSVENALGSGRDMRIEGDKLIGRTYFAQTTRAKEAESLARDGHVTGLSIGYISKGIWVEDETEYTAPNGKKYKGPVRIGIETRVREISLTPIPADALSRYRSAFVAARYDGKGMDVFDETVTNLNKEVERLNFDLTNARMALKLLSLKK